MRKIKHSHKIYDKTLQKKSDKHSKKKGQNILSGFVWSKISKIFLIWNCFFCNSACTQNFLRDHTLSTLTEF